ncbi:MIP family channel protein [Lachnospiraceae bacterium PAL227]|uniref:MIP family channel protein n=1 Tax=Ohessyouella blattaphilus TaxID=2949333 RepID=A0ABT1EGG2_9FIRM|nr:MIP family channel protein [Ohessyouella blattaphilus]MCR8562246.1 MIP family channel protein [Ohessyouella blattaphilus]MDL2249097.1 MIP family channel protein [Lachnospiraceae bacterium OttesenSCG-928-J05]
MKKYVAEFIGTAVLVIFGCGSAVAANTLLGGDLGVTTPLAFSTLLIAFAFGLSIVAMAYSIGNVSGCHINPAVSVGVFCAGKMSVTDFIGYLVAQFLGGIAGAGILTVFFGSNEALGQNGYGEASALGTEMAGAFLVEVVLTFVFVLLILGVTSKEKYGSIAGVVIGLTLVLIHILGIPFTGTSVNPARSFGPALLVGGEALKQVWLFIVAPVVGGILAALVYRFLLASEADA